MSEKSIEVMNFYMKEVWGNPSGLYEFSQKAKTAMENAREKIAKALNCEASGIYFTSGGSEADNQAIISAAKNGEKHGKKHIVSTAFEHHAVLHTLDKLEKQGFEISLLPVNSNGIIKLDDLRNFIREDTALVTVMFANNEIGSIQPIKEIGEICGEKGVLFHTDAVQAAGHIPIDIKNQNIDMLSLSAHKFHGPKGIGVLYAKKGIPLANIIEGGAQERGKRGGTENVPAIMAMSAALAEAVENIEDNTQKIVKLRDRLIKGLSTIPHCVLNGDKEKRLPGNANFCFEGIEGESLLLLLDDKGVAASSGSACTSGALDPSHVLLAIGRTHEIAHGSLRLSLSEYNTDEDIDHILKVVPEAVSYLRSISPLWRDKISGKKKFLI